MDSLLLGDRVAPDVFQIASELRRATLEEANRKWNASYEAYSPWMCCVPVMSSTEFIPRELLRQPTSDRGFIVTDEGYLRLAREFTESKSFLKMKGIFDQDPRDWLPSVELTAEQVSVFADGRVTLTQSNDILCEMYSQFVDFVLPLGGERNRGFVGHLTRGIIYRTIPKNCDKYDVAIDLAHEMGHNVLITWQSVDPIVSSDRRQMIYSQIRRTLRPVMQTFHAAVALAFMYQLVKLNKANPDFVEAGRRRGAKYTESLRVSLRLSVESLRRECKFTAIGSRILNELEEIGST